MNGDSCRNKVKGRVFFFQMVPNDILFSNKPDEKKSGFSLLEWSISCWFEFSEMPKDWQKLLQRIFSGLHVHLQDLLGYVSHRAAVDRAPRHRWHGVWPDPLGGAVENRKKMTWMILMLGPRLGGVFFFIFFWKIFLKPRFLWGNDPIWWGLFFKWVVRPPTSDAS